MKTYFSKEQIEEIQRLQKEGKSFSYIRELYNVSDTVIKKALLGKYTIRESTTVSKISEEQTKQCHKCGKVLPLSAFNKGNCSFGRRCVCRECEHTMQNTTESRSRKNRARALRRQNKAYREHSNAVDRKRRLTNEISYKKSMLRAARKRAKDFGLDYDLVLSDISIPKTCPLLEIPILIGQDIKNAPSIDRIDSNKGYTKDNIQVISNRANMLKSNGTLEEFTLLVKNWVH